MQITTQASRRLGAGVLFALAATFGVGMEALAQQQAVPKETSAAEDPAHTAAMPPLPESTDELLQIALRRSPQLALARSNIQQAEAQLRDAEQSLVKQIIMLDAKRRLARGKMEGFVTKQKQIEERMNAGTMDEADLQQSKFEESETWQAIVGIEAELRYLSGLGIGMAAEIADQDPNLAELTPGFREATRAEAPRNIPAVRQEIPEKLREALNMPISLNFEEATIEAVLAMLHDNCQVNFVVAEAVKGTTVSVQLEAMSVKDVLCAISDASRVNRQFVVFIVRDHGILATTNYDAESIVGASIPSEVPLMAPPGFRENVPG